MDDTESWRHSAFSQVKAPRCPFSVSGRSANWKLNRKNKSVGTMRITVKDPSVKSCMQFDKLVRLRLFVKLKSVATTGDQNVKEAEEVDIVRTPGPRCKFRPGNSGKPRNSYGCVQKSGYKPESQE